MREQARNRLAGDGITSLLPQLNLAPRENTHHSPPHHARLFLPLATQSPLPRWSWHRSPLAWHSWVGRPNGRWSSCIAAPDRSSQFPRPQTCRSPGDDTPLSAGQDHELARHSARSCFVSPPTYIAPWLKQLRGGLPNCPVPICPWAVKNKRVRQAALGSNQNSRANSKQKRF